MGDASAAAMNLASDMLCTLSAPEYLVGPACSSSSRDQCQDLACTAFSLALLQVGLMPEILQLQVQLI